MDRIRLYVFISMAVLVIAIALITIVNAVESGQSATENKTTDDRPYELNKTVNSTFIPGLGSAPVKFNDPPRGNQTATVNPPIFGSQPREDVVVYFKDMPSSLQDFASAHDVKLIFSKPDIKMAAFETMSVQQPGKKSVVSQNFIATMAKDPTVESAELDGFMFTDTTKNYTSQPMILTLEDLKKNNSEYIPNEVIVGFWKIPSSLDEFGAKYGGTIKNSSVDINYGLKFATFNTNNITSFINNVSTDPYVRYIEPNGKVQLIDPIGNPSIILLTNTSS